MRNESFVLFTKIVEVVRILTNEQKGVLFQTILDYQDTGNVPDDLDPVLKVAFLPIKHDMDVCAANREKVIQQRREAGKKSAEKRNAANEIATKANSAKRRSTKGNGGDVSLAPVNNNDNENVNVNVNVKDKDKDVSPEPQAASEPPAITLPLNDGSEYPITVDKVDKWKTLYPAVDVMQELRKMKGWCDANKTRRKTRTGVERFIVAWLAREQDKSPAKGAQGPQTRPQTRFHNLEERDDDPDALALAMMRARLEA